MGFFSNLFKKKDRTPALPDTVRQALDRMVSILNDDDKQNALMPVHLQSILLQGAAIDEINGGEGPFGKNPCNPIPVNGPLGEITYLSRLLTKSEGQPLFFHRLGSRQNIDVYEVVSWDGSVWDILYFDYYHKGKTRKAPEDYTFAESINEAAGACANSIFGVPLSNPFMRNINTSEFVRPADHARFVQDLLEVIQNR